jgi:iron complex outermembrane receptor protein
LVTEDLVLSTSYSYIDSEITDYPLFETETASDSRVGQPQSSVAKNSYTLAADYTLPLDQLGEIAFHVDYSYTGSRKNEPVGDGSAASLALIAAVEDELTSGYKDVGARITFRSLDGHWRAALYGQNLTDEQYLYKLGGFSTATGSPSAARSTPRLYGMELNYTF